MLWILHCETLERGESTLKLGHCAHCYTKMQAFMNIGQNVSLSYGPLDQVPDALVYADCATSCMHFG